MSVFLGMNFNSFFFFFCRTLDWNVYFAAICYWLNISVKRKSGERKWLNISGFKSRKCSSSHVLSVAIWGGCLMLCSKWMLLDTKLIHMLTLFVLWSLTFLPLWDVKIPQSFDLDSVKTERHTALNQLMNSQNPSQSMLALCPALMI